MYERLFSMKADMDIVEDKEWVFKTYKSYFYMRLLEMFEYKNLPDTIPSEMLEMYLLSGGCCFFTEVNGEYYVFEGSLGGEPDPYYRPTLFTVANPALKLSENYDIQKDGVLCKNDKLLFGLDYLVTRTASLMAENLITMNMADVILRSIMMLSAPDDRTKASAEEFLKKLKKGEMGVIADSPLFDGIKRFDSSHSSSGYITQFIEYHQYIKGSFFNEIGLNANFNMKRESIGKGEASLTQDTIFPICDTMFSSRKEFVKKINEKYGLNISVDFSSIWKQNRLESEYELEALKADSQSKESSQLEKKGDEEIETNEAGESSDATGESSDSTGESSDSTEETNEEEASEETDSTDETTEESTDPIVEIDIQVNADNIEEEEGVEDAGSEAGEEEDK